MGAVPYLCGLRIPVATVVALVAEGETTDDIPALCPDLDADDVDADAPCVPSASDQMDFASGTHIGRW
jgi:uncharacterized protein (DUF433 family)